MKSISIFAVIFLASPAFAADSPPPQKWTYDNDFTGQEDWGAVKEYAICREGMNQSPVIISFTEPTNLSPLNFDYKQANGTIKTENDKSFTMEVQDGGNIIDDGKKYQLTSIELHSPSEHKIKDKTYPAEIHLIHKDKNGDMLIVAAFAIVDNENPAIEKMLKQAEKNNSDKITINVTELIPTTKHYYAYNGSLPYPPCSENVRWRIINKFLVPMSSQQLAELNKYVGRNARLPQPLYMRKVLESR